MYISKDKENQTKKIKDLSERKILQKNSTLCPENNIISSIFDDVSTFSSNILDKKIEIKPQIYLINMELDVLKKNKYNQASPFYDKLFNTIYFNLSDKLDNQYGKYSFQHLSDFELKLIFSHEYFHFLESTVLNSWKIKEEKRVLEIISESRADYFSGMYLNTIEKKEIDIGKEVQKFVQGLGYSLDPYALEYSEKIFYLIDGDTHGSAEHRLKMYQKGLYEGSREYLLDYRNFLPGEITYLSRGTKSSDLHFQ